RPAGRRAGPGVLAGLALRLGLLQRDLRDHGEVVLGELQAASHVTAGELAALAAVAGPVVAVAQPLLAGLAAGEVLRFGLQAELHGGPADVVVLGEAGLVIRGG